MKSLIVILLFFFAATCSVASYTNTVEIENYSYKHGLNTSNVNYVLKDSKGFLWICSMDGVFRFDGYSFRNLNTFVKDTFNVETLCITEDKRGNFLIGTNGKGIFCYNIYSERIYHVKLDNGGHSNVNRILFFQNKIWLATSIGLIIIDNPDFDQNTIVKTRVLLPKPLDINSPNNTINTLMFTTNGNSLWVGSNGSLFEMNTSTYKFIDVNPYPQNSIRCFSRYSKNMIIGGSWDGGVFGINTVKKEIQNNPLITEINRYVGNDRIIDVCIDTKKRIWVATFGNGLYIFEKDKQGIISCHHYKNDKEKGNIKSNFINRMFVDSSDIAWLSMNQPALSKIYFPQNDIEFTYMEDENDIGEIMSVAPTIEKDKLLVATLSDIYVFNTLKKQSKQYKIRLDINKAQLNNISNCMQDSRGNIWIVDRRSGLFLIPAKHSSGLLVKNHKTEIYPIDANDLLLPDEGGAYINVLFEDSKGRIWLGSWGSLFVVDIKPGFSNANYINDLLLNSHVSNIYSIPNREKFNFPIVPVFSIVEINENQYWAGTSNIGIIQFEETKNGDFNGTLVSFNNQLPGKNIKCLFKDKIGNVWMGTNAGLSKYSKNSDIITTYSIKNGLASENINNIVEDNRSNIWVSTSYGVSKVNPFNNIISNFLYSRNEYLNQYIPYAAAIDSIGSVYFSSKDALAAIDPENTTNYTEEPPLFFTDIKIDNHKVIPNEKYGGKRIIDANINYCKIINVPYNHTLSIEFTALDFISPEQNIYKYRIGNIKEWALLNSNQRSLILPAMSPGEYNLDIMLANAHNNDIKRSIRINYLPPFWKSKLAFVIYFIILFYLFYFYRKLTIQKIQKDTIIEKERYERKKLQELDMMKSEFFSNISHEFRTPLSLIINPLESNIKDTTIPENKREKMKTALKSTYRLLKLTNELMDFSKIEKKLMLPDYTSCEMVSFISEICTHYQNLAESLNIDFKLNCPLDKIEVPIDAGMIEKVIFNLLSNAFKYTMMNGVIMVNISKTQSDNINYIKISVINTGEGISEKVIHKIFDKYYQVNNVQNKQIEGTGIGLSLVKSYVELHNGKVEVKSKPGRETCFDVYLPFYQSDYQKSSDEVIVNNDQLPKLQVLEPDRNVVKPSTHYTILLVEDDVEIRNYIADELANDFKIVTAENGGEGLKYANEIIPDLIVSDIVMPVLSGIELCRNIKSQLSTSHIPFILLSAKTTITEQIEGLETGADVYIPKPFSLGHLRVQILRLISFKEKVYLRYLKENTLIPEKSLNSELDEAFMQKVISFIEQNLADPNLDVEQLSDFVSLSHAQTYRKVRAISGMSVVKFIRTIRLKKAAKLVTENKLTYTEIAYETGFSSLSYFTRCFHDHFGKSPSDFMAGFKE